MTSPDLIVVPLVHPVTLQNEIALLKSGFGVNPITTMSASDLQLQWNNQSSVFTESFHAQFLFFLTFTY